MNYPNHEVLITIFPASSDAEKPSRVQVGSNSVILSEGLTVSSGRNILPENNMESKKCNWSEDEDGVWETECNEAFCFENGSPHENKANFCPFCGGILIERKYSEPLTDDEQ